MTRSKNIRNKLTRLIRVRPLSGRCLLVLVIIGGGLGLGFGPSLLFGSFALAFGLGSPGCRLLASIPPRLVVCLPSLFGGQQTALFFIFLSFIKYK